MFVGCNFTPLNTEQNQITNGYIYIIKEFLSRRNKIRKTYPLTRQVNGSSQVMGVLLAKV